MPRTQRITSAMTNQADPRYPIGPFRRETPLTTPRRSELIEQIALLPSQLEEALRNLEDAELCARYRPGGWTLRQVVHHIADSHINAYVRFRLALTEDVPLIKPYDEGSWAELSDVAIVPIGISVSLVEALHARWSALLSAMTLDQFARELHHPDHNRRITLDEMLGMYAWHGRHHIAHLDVARGRRPYNSAAEAQ